MLINVALIILVAITVHRMYITYRARKQWDELRKDMRFCYMMMRILALEGEWPPRCKEKLIEIMKEEDIPTEGA